MTAFAKSFFRRFADYGFLKDVLLHLKLTLHITEPRTAKGGFVLIDRMKILCENLRRIVLVQKKSASFPTR